MSDLDIKAKVKSYLNQFFENRAWRDEDINVDVLKLTPSDVKWYAGRPVTREGINSTVTVQKNANTPNSDEALHQMHTEKESDVMGKITLDEGVLKGLNKMLVLELGDIYFKKILGDRVKINLGKKVTELKNDKMTIAVSIEVGGHSASAAINTQKVTYKGNFECDVTLSGNVIIEGPDGGVLQQDISDILRPPVRHVKGKIEFLWDKEQNVNMTGD
ncbi:hypothetical protein BsWGS_07312 [Bradybaena similaris]